MPLQMKLSKSLVSSDTSGLKMSFDFEILPERIQNLLFSYLSFSDLTELRPTNRWFNETVSALLNRRFMRVKQDVENEMRAIFDEAKLIESNDNREEKPKKDADDEFDEISRIQLRYKILRILRSEISILYAVCARYVKLGMYCFTGGQILDYFYEIMNKGFNLTEAKNPLESHATMQLFLLNEEFMDYFEEVIEPVILGRHPRPWFGVKITDFLDLYANSNYHISANYHDEHLKLSARYEVLNPETVTEVDFSESTNNMKKLMKLSRYIRNQVRWQNFFYYVDAPYESVKNMASKRDRRYNKLCLNPGEVSEDGGTVYNDEEIAIDRFNKTFSRRLGNPCSKENVSYGIELRCHKNCIPTRMEPYVASVTQGDHLQDCEKSENNISDYCSFSAITAEISSIYDFILTVKVVLPTENKNHATETYLEIYQNNQILKVSRSTKEIPI